MEGLREDAGGEDLKVDAVKTMKNMYNGKEDPLWGNQKYLLEKKDGEEGWGAKTGPDRSEGE